MRIQKHKLPCCICGAYEPETLYRDELNDTAPAVEYNFTPDTRKTYAIAKCRQCGHIYTDPMPLLDDVYQDSEDEVYSQHREQREKCFRKLAHPLWREFPSGDLLDIGCATGILLDVMAERYRTFGVEPSAWSRTQCAPRHHVAASLDAFAGQTFDIITLLGVIEHIYTPQTLIADISRMLRPGGLFLVYTGDIDAWLPRLLRKKWWWYQGMHLHYFSKKNLSRLLGLHGLRTIRTLNMPLYFKVESLSKSLSRYETLHRLVHPILSLPVINNLMVPMPISGELLLVARKEASTPRTCSQG